MGFDILTFVRKGRSPTPVIILSGHLHAANMLRAQRMRAAVLVKDGRAEDFIDQLLDVLLDPPPCAYDNDERTARDLATRGAAFDVLKGIKLRVFVLVFTANKGCHSATARALGISRSRVQQTAALL